MNILKIKRALAELVWTGALLFAAASVGAAFSHTRKIGTVGLGCLEYNIIFLAKTQRFIKR